MSIALIFLAVAVLLWGLLCVRTVAPVWLGVAAVLVGYVFGHAFWHAKVGPLPLTIDRAFLAAVAGAFGWRMWKGRLATSPWATVDWALAATLAWLTGSALLAGSGTGPVSEASPMWRLLFSFWAPGLLYLAARQSGISTRGGWWLLGGLVTLGGYLALTALAETAGVWSLVFPRYISNPELGLHFGRARGPALNSVSLGVYLAICFWAAWLWLPHLPRPARVALFVALPVIVLAVYLTYTRSTYLGLAASGVAVLAAQLPPRIRWKTVGGVLAAGALSGVVLLPALLRLEREDSGGVSAHSVQQREAFAYVSWQMFQDYPVAGVGFGRFTDKKLPYLADRTQPFELESLRPLQHHNTFLSLLTETGLVGLAAYVGVLVGVAASAWRLSQLPHAAPHERSLGVLALAAVMVYLPSALFHDLSLVHTDQWLLFLIAGVAVGCERRRALGAPVPSPTPAMPPGDFNHRPAWQPFPQSQSYVNPASKNPVSMNTPPTVSLFGMNIARVTIDQAADAVLDWCAAKFDGRCRFVVTPNVDHVVMHAQRGDLRSAYTDASLVVADGAPLVAASQLLGRTLPERVAGSDLVPRLLKRGGQEGKPLRVFLLGAGPGIADQAAGRIAQHYPGVQVVGTHCPPLGFENNPRANAAAIAAVNATQPDVLIVGLGAPKQELWVHQHQDRLHAKAALCAGATIDFLAGHKQRSPEWMQRLGAEWLHRLASEPRRLAGRYARDAWFFPQLVWQEWRAIGRLAR